MNVGCYQYVSHIDAYVLRDGAVTILILVHRNLKAPIDSLLVAVPLLTVKSRAARLDLNRERRKQKDRRK